MKRFLGPVAGILLVVLLLLGFVPRILRDMRRTAEEKDASKRARPVSVVHPEPVKDYDQIILLMEGEVLAAGTHAALLERSPEYAQIYDSQRSTSQYESLRA